jgi:hypothetical protein
MPVMWSVNGWSLYAKGGRLKYCYNFFGVKLFFIESTKTMPAGTHQVRMEFKYDGGGLGKAGVVSLYDGFEAWRRGLQLASARREEEQGAPEEI